MASATRETATKEIVTTVEEPVIRLDLTEDEAKVVLAMASRVRGLGDDCYRKEALAIKGALQGLEIYVWGRDYFAGTLDAQDRPTVY